jgi:putative glutamine amidotransferase
MKIAIVGRKKDTASYEDFCTKIPAEPVTTLSMGVLPSCDALILPGGGDITPAFFGEHNNGSQNIDTELDIIQFQAMDYCIRHHVPVMGICKGMQVINVAFGGTISQDLPTASLHQYIGEDQYHNTLVANGSFLFELYGKELVVNSAHHQGLNLLGRELLAIQWGMDDNCVEAIIHDTLPVIGLQWHPERLDQKKALATAAPLLSYFSSLI